MTRPALTITVQMDALGAIEPPTDSSLIMMREAARRGHKLYHYTPDKLSLKNGMPVASARPVIFVPPPVGGRSGGGRESARSNRPHPNPPLWGRGILGDAVSLPLTDADVVLMRQDPPFNMAYISSTYMLERLHGTTLVVNDPRAVRDNPEKLFPLQFPEFIPPTLISANADDIRAFHREQNEIVLKPLYGHGGAGVFHIARDGANFSALLELLLAAGTPLVAQKFLPEVKTGERRIILVDGKLVGLYARLPASGEIRSNIHIGGTAAKADITPRQREICEALGPVLREKGMLMVGFDVVGDWLTEINVTSPTGFSWLHKLYGTTPERDFWDAVEKRL